MTQDDFLRADKALTEQLRTAAKQKRTRLKTAARMQAPLHPRNDLLPDLRVELVKSESIAPPSPRNVRMVDDLHVQAVAASIQTLGFITPVLVGSKGVINGWTSVLAARRLGLEFVPVIRISHLSDAEQRLARLAVNRLGEKGQWDTPALQAEMVELQALNVPLQVTGFASEEIDQISLTTEDSGFKSGPLEPEEGVSAVTRPGDIWQLGEAHRVMCGDATDAAVLRLLMSTSELARMVFTDIPYNVPIQGNVTKGPHREFLQASGEMSPERFEAFNVAWIAAVLPLLSDGGLLVTSIDWRGLHTVNAAALSAGLTAFNLIVWAKTNAGMGSLYRSNHELLPFYKKGTAPHVNNVALGKKGRWRSNLWTYPGASSRGSDARAGLKDHPTVKPVAMLADAILDVTLRDDLIIDPFLGSGSTLIACEETGRRCAGVEIDPLYVDVIIRRFQRVTGKHATLVDTEKVFGAVEIKRKEAVRHNNASEPP